LRVREERLGSQRIREAWLIQENEITTQLPSETTAQAESLDQYRQAVEWTWTDEELNERDVRRLNKFANRLDLSQSVASAVEVGVMGGTKSTRSKLRSKPLARRRNPANSSMRCALGRGGHTRIRNGKRWSTSSNRYVRKSQTTLTPKDSWHRLAKPQ
jgi:hypothetical protein